MEITILLIGVDDNYRGRGVDCRERREKAGGKNYRKNIHL